MPFESAYVPVVINPSGTYTLAKPVAYQGRTDRFVVPEGFITDLASVPRFLSWLIPIAGVHDRAAITHDWLCVELEAGNPALTAVDVDGIFRRILRELGVPVVRRWLFWTGVRIGALGTPARRPGWWKTAPAVFAISLLALPVIGPAAWLVGLTVLVADAVEAVVGRVAK